MERTSVRKRIKRIMKKVVIYTAPICVYCEAAKRFFEKNNVPFEEKDISKDESAREELESISHQLSVPVIEVGDDVFMGFDRKAIAEALGLK